MAYTRADYLTWKHLRDRDLIPPHPRVLEIGAANWYGDMDPHLLVDDIERYVPEEHRARLRQGLRATLADRPEGWLFTVAYIFRYIFLGSHTTDAIDLHGPPRALKMDLNRPMRSSEPHDILINSGTAEHIFNQHQFWKNCHDLTRTGGLMVHAVPLWGWLDHGFYNYHPTFIADLAHVNGYETLLWAYHQIDPFAYELVEARADFDRFDRAHSSMMYVVWRKAGGDEFQTPQQGVYSARSSPEEYERWQTQR